MKTLSEKDYDRTIRRNAYAIYVTDDAGWLEGCHDSEGVFFGGPRDGQEFVHHAAGGIGPAGHIVVRGYRAARIALHRLRTSGDWDCEGVARRPSYAMRPLRGPLIMAAPSLAPSRPPRIPRPRILTADIAARLLIDLDEAERKAWDSLARYKFQMFGYWAAIWVHTNRIGDFRLRNPFTGIVQQARVHNQQRAWRDHVEAINPKEARELLARAEVLR